MPRIASAPPPEMPLYPDLPADDDMAERHKKDGSSFRLQKISELQKQLEGERDVRAALYKKYRRAVNVTDAVEVVLVIASMLLGAGGIGLLTTVVAASIVVALEAVALACGLAGIGCKFVSRKLLSKARKHDEVRVLAESKLNSIADIVSHSLKDNVVSDDEFRVVLSEVDKYSELKRQIRLKAHHAYAAVKMDQEEKNALIRQGREEAHVNIAKALGGESR